MPDRLREPRRQLQSWNSGAEHLYGLAAKEALDTAFDKLWFAAAPRLAVVLAGADGELIGYTVLALSACGRSMTALREFLEAAPDGTLLINSRRDRLRQQSGAADLSEILCARRLYIVTFRTAARTARGIRWQTVSSPISIPPRSSSIPS